MVVPPVQSRLEQQSDGAKGLPGIFAPKRAGVKSRTGDGSVTAEKVCEQDRGRIYCPGFIYTEI